MRYRFLPGLIGIVVVLLSLALLAWGFWPVGRSSRRALLHLPEAAGDNQAIQLDWPSRLRLGDTGAIRLVLGSAGSQADAGSKTQRLVESRLEASGIKAVPAGEILEPLLAGRQVIFFWRVLPQQSGEHDVIIWVRLHPETGEGGASSSQILQQSQLLTAQKITIRTVDLFGLDGQLARWLGGVGMVFGLALCLDGFLLSRNHNRKEVKKNHA